MERTLEVRQEHCNYGGGEQIQIQSTNAEEHAYYYYPDMGRRSVIGDGQYQVSRKNCCC